MVDRQCAAILRGSRRHESADTSACSGIALDDLKRAVLKALDDQYEPKDGGSEAGTTTSQSCYRRIDRYKLSYGPDWIDLSRPDGPLLLVVSALNEEESGCCDASGAPGPNPYAVADLAANNGSDDAVTAATPLLRRLATDDSGLAPLPLPGHIDDWLAQYREAPQSTQEMRRQRPATSGREQCNLHSAASFTGQLAMQHPPYRPASTRSGSLSTCAPSRCLL